MLKKNGCDILGLYTYDGISQTWSIRCLNISHVGTQRTPHQRPSRQHPLLVPSFFWQRPPLSSSSRAPLASSQQGVERRAPLRRRGSRLAHPRILRLFVRPKGIPKPAWRGGALNPSSSFSSFSSAFSWWDSSSVSKPRHAQMSFKRTLTHETLDQNFVAA